MGTVVVTTLREGRVVTLREGSVVKEGKPAAREGPLLGEGDGCLATRVTPMATAAAAAAPTANQRARAAWRCPSFERDAARPAAPMAATSMGRVLSSSGGCSLST
jgi:hypothetical protein